MSEKVVKNSDQVDISNLGMTDQEGRLIVFPNEEEAIIYAAMLERLYPDIWFVRIHTTFSINGGKFYTIEPIGKPQEGSSELCIVDSKIMVEIVKELERFKQEDLEETDKKKPSKEIGIVKPE